MCLTPTKICNTSPFENGSGPSWSRGNSTIVRVGDMVYATNMRVVPELSSLNRTVMEIYSKRDGGEWARQWSDEGEYQREPCPVIYADGRLIVSSNPVIQPEKENRGRCVPKLYIFDIDGENVVKSGEIIPEWDDPAYDFIEHSYRSFARDTISPQLRA